MTFDASAFELNAEAKEGKKFGRPKPWNYSSICSHVIDLWTSTKEGKDNKTGESYEYEARSVYISFAFQSLKVIDNDDGTQEVSEEKEEFIYGKKYTLSFSNGSNLYKDVSSWLGSIPDDQAKKFNVFSLIGKPVLVNIVEHKPKDKKYSKIGALSALPDGMPEYKSEVKLDGSMMTKDLLNEDLFKYLPLFAKEDAENSKEYFEITGKKTLAQDEAEIEAELEKATAQSETQEVSSEDVEDIFETDTKEEKMP